jgi:hypothetical protein
MVDATHALSAVRAAKSCCETPPSMVALKTHQHLSYSGMTCVNNKVIVGL